MFPSSLLFFNIIQFILKVFSKFCRRNFVVCFFGALRDKNHPNITLKRSGNFDPLKSLFYVVKLGFTGGYIIIIMRSFCSWGKSPPWIQRVHYLKNHCNTSCWPKDDYVHLEGFLGPSEAKKWNLLFTTLFGFLLDECPNCLYFLLIWLYRLLWLQKMTADIGWNVENVILDHMLEVLQCFKIWYQHSYM